MKKRKLILLIGILIMATGCNANYEVEIYNHTIHEKMDLIEPTSISAEDNEQKIGEIFTDYFGNADVLYMRDFKQTVNQKNEEYSLSEKSNYSFQQYNTEIKAIQNCCRSVDFNDDGKYITFRTLGYFKWFDNYKELENLKIVIKSNHKLKETNADIIKGHSYIWYIDRDNYKDVMPSIVLYSNKYVFNYNNEFFKKFIYIGVIIGIIVVVGGPSYLIIKKKQNQANEI